MADQASVRRVREPGPGDLHVPAHQGDGAADSGLALLRVPAPAGQVRFRPAWRDPHGWAALGPVVRWTLAELDAVAAWWDDVVEDRDSSWDGPVWAGGVGLRRVAADPHSVAVDVCVLGDDDVQRPGLTGEEAVPVGGDTRFHYVTLDASPDEWAGGLVLLRAWQEESSGA
jgi:hypothetical protein